MERKKINSPKRKENLSATEYTSDVKNIAKKTKKRDPQPLPKTSNRCKNASCSKYNSQLAKAECIFYARIIQNCEE